MTAKTAKAKNDWGLKITPEKAAEAIMLLQQYVEERIALVEKGTIKDPATAVKMMAAVQDFNTEVAKRIKSPSEGLYNTLRFTTVPTAFDENDTTKLGVDGIGTCRLQDDIQVKVQDSVALHKWLTDNGLEDIIVETVNAQTLAAQMRARIKENAENTARAMKAGTTDPAKLQEIQLDMPPAEVVSITPVVRAQITRE